MDWVWAVLRCKWEATSRAITSGAAMVASLVEKGESGSALALLEVLHCHPTGTMTLMGLLHTGTYREERRMVIVFVL